MNNDQTKALACLQECAKLLQGSNYPEMAGNIKWAAAALSPTTEEPSPPFAQLRQAAMKRLDEFFEGKPGFRLVVDHYLLALEREVKVLAGSAGYTYPAPIPFPVFEPRGEMEQYYVTSEQRPEPHLLMWGDGENNAEWCEWDGDAYEPSRETVTGFWPKPKELRPAVVATTGEGRGWVPGLPRLEDNCRRLFKTKLSNGKERELHWLENYTLDTHGDEQQHTGWYTCRENLKQGYALFFEPYKGPAVHYFQVDLALPATPIAPSHA